MEWATENTLTSGQRKLKRGIEQVKTLCEEARAFENDKAYLFETERKPRSVQEVEYRCFAIERKTMPDHWPLLAGEAIQNLRSALDHLVYEKSGGASGTQFPIFTDAGRFQGKSGQYMKGVSGAVRTFIEEVQPYRFMPEHAAQHPLAQLRSLSNLDKHRVLATVVSSVTKEAIGKPNGVELTWEEYASRKLLGAGKAHISTFVVRAEGEVQDVNVETFFSYEVLIEGRPLRQLVGIGHTVYKVFWEVDTGKRMTGAEPFPL